MEFESDDTNPKVMFTLGVVDLKMISDIYIGISTCFSL